MPAFPPEFDLARVLDSRLDLSSASWDMPFDGALIIWSVLVMVLAVSRKVPKGSGATMDPRRRGDRLRVPPIVKGGKGGFLVVDMKV